MQCESINKEELPIFKSEQKVTQVDRAGASVGLGLGGGEILLTGERERGGAASEGPFCPFSAHNIIFFYPLYPIFLPTISYFPEFSLACIDD